MTSEMMKLVLWRAEYSERPYFGHGSYWAIDRGTAESFGHWLSTLSTREAMTRRAIPVSEVSIYRATIETPTIKIADFRPLFDLRRNFWDDHVKSKFTRLADLGVEWVIFFDWWYPDSTRTATQVVYIGTEPITVEPAQ
jgi:hypothetical protein